MHGCVKQSSERLEMTTPDEVRLSSAQAKARLALLRELESKAAVDHVEARVLYKAIAKMYRKSRKGYEVRISDIFREVLEQHGHELKTPYSTREDQVVQAIYAVYWNETIQVLQRLERLSRQVA